MTVTGKTAPKFGTGLPAITNITECCTKEVQFGAEYAFLFGGGFCSASSTYQKREKGDSTMALTINTNISSIIAQRSLNNATNNLNTSLERMSTGYKINHAKDNAAGYSIASMWKTQLGSLDVAADNAATGSDMLTSAEQTYGLLSDHLQRIRDLTEQAANGTYASASLKAIQSEIEARLDEITRVASNAEFNGIKLMSYVEDGVPSGVGITKEGINLQVGLYSDKNSVINLDVELFRSATVSGLFSKLEGNQGGQATLEAMMQQASGGNYTDIDTAIKDANFNKVFAAACSSLIYDTATGEYKLASDGDDTTHGAKEMLGFIDAAIDDISSRVTRIGAAQNRVESAITALDVQSQNLTSSLSTLRDTDVAEESSNYIQSQILQQASATLLATANQTPSIALNLV